MTHRQGVLAVALAAVAAVGVMAAIGVSATSVSTPSCRASVNEGLLASRIVGNSNSYRRDNPSEYGRVRTYLDGGARPSTTGMTRMGLHLVYLEDTCRAPDGTSTTTTTTTTTTPPPPPPPPPSGAAAGIGLMAFSGNLESYDHLSDYSYVIFSVSDENVASPLPGKTLVYVSPAIPSDQYDDPGITYSQANANGWLLKDSSGNFIHPYNSTHRWVPDIGLPAVQQHFVTRMQAYFAANPGIDGFEIDNVLPDIAYFNISRTWPAKYPNATAWQNAQVAFMQAVGPPLRAQGRYVLINASGYTPQAGFDAGTFSQGWFARLADTGGVDGIFAEDWLQNPNDVTQLMDNSNPGSFMTSYAGWQGLQQVTNAHGVEFVAIMNGPSVSSNATLARRLMRYGKASFLLDWNGRGMYGYAVGSAGGYHSGTSPWDVTWTSDYGQPSGVKTQPQANVWRREYSKGTVVVNSSTSSYSASVGGTSYSVPARDAVLVSR